MKKNLRMLVHGDIYLQIVLNDIQKKENVLTKKVNVLNMENEKEIERDYKKEYSSQKAFVVVLNCEVLGTWRNLKKLCEDMKERDGQFFSYSSLSKRRDKENPMEFETAKGKYRVYIEKLQ